MLLFLLVLAGCQTTRPSFRTRVHENCLAGDQWACDLLESFTRAKQQHDNDTPETFSFTLNWDRLREARRREGSYLLQSNMASREPAELWSFYLRLVKVEQVFKELKGDLAIRPIYHQTDARIEAHIFVAFLAYCLQVTLRLRLRALAPGLTPCAMLEKMAAIQMVDVHLPATDGRTIVLSRYTEPEADQALLLQQLKLRLPDQPPPRIIAGDVPKAA